MWLSWCVLCCRIIDNVAALVCCDPAEMPDANLPDPVESSLDNSKLGGRKSKGAVEAPDVAAEAAAEAAAVARKVHSSYLSTARPVCVSSCRNDCTC